MLRTRVMPCLLLRNRGLVKSVRFRDASYVGDPINTIRIFNEKEVDELILLDVTATPDGKPINLALISEVAGECFMPLTYGGGIRSVEDARRVFELGVEKIAVNSAACGSPGLVGDLADVFGNQSIVAAIDARKRRFGKHRVWTRGGSFDTGWDAVEWAQQVERLGAGEILLTSIDRDGTFEGYDLELVRSVAAAVSVPVIACGGAGKVSDFRVAVVEGGAAAVAAGSMFVYQGPNRAVLINFPSSRDLEALFP